MSEFSPEEFLARLRRRGARRLRRVNFRKNRSTIWSLTGNGTILNVHSAFRYATPELLDAFAIIAREGGVSSRAAAAASERLCEWPSVKRAIAALRSSHERRLREAEIDGEEGITFCCATPRQREYLRRIYSYFNATRFGGRLPRDIPVRLSNRMTSALGHMLPGEHNGRRYVVEIALNVDLMLSGNGAERVDTLLHEMAHAADYLQTGYRGHGRSWRELAVRVGCRPDTMYDRPVKRRARRGDPVTRVPPLPHALRRKVA